MDHAEGVFRSHPDHQQERTLQSGEGNEGKRTTHLIKSEKTMAKKGNRLQVILECTEHKNSGQPGTSRYITTKNKKNNPERLELKKYNPILKKMTVHKEIK